MSERLEGDFENLVVEVKVESRGSLNDGVKECVLNVRSEDIRICGVNLSKMSKWQQILTCCLFVCIFYITGGLILEYLYSMYDFSFGFFITLIQMAVNSFLSFFSFFRMTVDDWKKEIERSGKVCGLLQYFLKNSSKNIGYYFLISVLSISMNGLSNQSLIYLNFPTSVLIKSSKLIVIMLLSFCILSKKYSWLDYASTLLLMLGLFFVFNANKEVSIEFDFRGMLLLVFSISASSILSNVQEKLLQEKKEKVLRLVFFENFIGILYSLIICLLFNQFHDAITFCRANPMVIVLIVLYSISCYIAVLFIHTITKIEGVVVTQTVCSVRKVLSIFLSFVLFPKPFHIYHFVGSFFVFGGVGARILNRVVKKKSNKKADISKV